MRYSYCWAVDPGYLNERARDIDARRWPAQAFVRITRLCGPDVDFTHERDDEELQFLFSGEHVSIIHHSALMAARRVDIIAREPDDIIEAAAGCSGRVLGAVIETTSPSGWDDSPEHDEVVTFVDSRASRFHGASIAGLAVGAMGVFVLAVAFRHWLGERRKFRPEARV
jgi:hypothetical protein